MHLTNRAAARFTAGLVLASMCIVPALAVTGTVNTGSSTLRVRSEANTESPVLDKLSHGTKVDVLSTSNGWYKISYEELPGYVPTSEFYDRRYRGSWNSLTVSSLAIGQGELGVTPLQVANLGATIANRGYYYIPHVVKKIAGQDSIDARFYRKNYTMVDPKYFEPIVEGMYEAVNVAGTATRFAVPGLDICGKTGTAQNPAGADHSTFLCFAPRNNPKIVVSVYVEHGRWGATAAAPIASLLVEQYLTDTIKRPDMLRQVKEMTIAYPMYDKRNK